MRLRRHHFGIVQAGVVRLLDHFKLYYLLTNSGGFGPGYAPPTEGVSVRAARQRRRAKRMPGSQLAYRHDNGWLERVGRRETAGLDGSLLRVHPIIVRSGS